VSTGGDLKILLLIWVAYGTAMTMKPGKDGRTLMEANPMMIP